MKAETKMTNAEAAENVSPAALSRLLQSLKRRGPGPTLRLAWKNVVHEWRTYLDGRFDRRLGVETAGKVELDALHIDSENKRHGVLYEPTPLHTFRRIIRGLPILPADYVFVDYGSGKGRVVIAANELGFKHVIGVEFSSELCAVAAHNLASYGNRTRRPVNVELRCMDAVEFEIPEVPCVLYFFNPFERPILEAIARKIARSYERNGRRIYIVHYNPVNTDLFGALSFLRRINAADTVFEFAGPRRRRFVCYESLGDRAAS